MQVSVCKKILIRSKIQAMNTPNESILLYQGKLEILQEISEQEVIDNLG
jgi:hypothetical protein